MKTLILVALVAAVIGNLSGVFIGVRIGSKAAREAVLPCPACSCPPAVEVNLADFDVDKINNKKGTFNYNPTLSNVRIVIEAKDSTLLKNLLKSAK